jgi:hypothetical protein
MPDEPITQEEYAEELGPLAKRVSDAMVGEDLIDVINVLAVLLGEAIGDGKTEQAKVDMFNNVCALMHAQIFGEDEDDKKH